MAVSAEVILTHVAEVKVTHLARMAVFRAAEMLTQELAVEIQGFGQAGPIDPADRPRDGTIAQYGSTVFAGGTADSVWAARAAGVQARSV